MLIGLYKYDQEVYDMFIDLFAALPLAAVIDGRILALHGGISPELHSMRDLETLNRFREPTCGPLLDVLWADPRDGIEIFSPNDSRGCSCYFGESSLKHFLKRNKLSQLIRAHELFNEGYKIFKWGDPRHPELISIFSAPNYCDMYKNKGAVLSLTDKGLRFAQISSSPHPFVLRGYMDVF
jgi:serine/threonine-protein phosphatase 2B catalytic subunit